MTTCAECGFDAEATGTEAIGDALGAYPARYRAVLAGADPALIDRRPAPQVWSALEYTCHVRDVLVVQRERAVRALVEECPSFPRMHRDERVAWCRYGAQPADVVAGQLTMASELLVLVLDRLGPAEWAHPVRYHWPDEAVRDLAWMGRHTLHECHHHLFDLRAGLDELARRA